jgi:hypothetical protein
MVLLRTGRGSWSTKLSRHAEAGVKFMACWVIAIAKAMLVAADLSARRYLVVTAMMLADQCTAVGNARAEDEHLGIIEYEIACLPCHGLEGRGDGPMANNLQVRPADLTQIAKANGSVFPARKVNEMIDGRADVAGHLIREMPVWGHRYRKVIEPGESNATVDLRAREQIDALVQHLGSIQEK